MKDRAPLLEVGDLPTDENLDMALGVEDGPGGRMRVLTRQRGTVKSVLPAAAKIAQAEAAKTQGRIVSATPSAIRMEPVPGDQDLVQLDYDVVDEHSREARIRPRSRAHQVRVVVMAKKGSPLRPRAR